MKIKVGHSKQFSESKQCLKGHLKLRIQIRELSDVLRVSADSYAHTNYCAILSDVQMGHHIHVLFLSHLSLGTIFICMAVSHHPGVRYRYIWISSTLVAIILPCGNESHKLYMECRTAAAENLPPISYIERPWFLVWFKREKEEKIFFLSLFLLLPFISFLWNR